MARKIPSGGKDAADDGKKPKSSVTAASASRGHRNREQPVDLGRALVEAYLTNERINQVVRHDCCPSRRVETRPPKNA
jgi:hypothetical protein